MNLYTIECGNFKLDGGAMFGVVPKSLWQRTNPADNNNMINIATRSLLIERGRKLILIDCGLGNKQNEKFFSYYYRWGDHTLDDSLTKYGFHRDDITDIILTHLHFDHCGGCIQWNNKKTFYEPAFKNAIFWSNKDHWDWATNPNQREKASFKTENILPIEESGQLRFFSTKKNILQINDFGIEIIFVDGHTEKQMLPIVNYKNTKIIFAADLIPTIGHIPLHYITSFDIRPLLSLNEKKNLETKIVNHNYFIFLEHDAENEICTLKNSNKGMILDKTLKCLDFF